MRAPTSAGPESLREANRQLRALDDILVKAARVDVNCFAEYVIQDEQTGKPIVQAWPHRRWHRLADEHERLMLWAHVEGGKTQQLAVIRTLFALGQNPNLRIGIVSNTAGQAQKILRSISRYVEQSARLRKVFPNLAPSLPWTGSALTVKRTTLSKDPSVQALGVHGAILGSRLDLLILDDILDFENARTPEQRKMLIDWYNATLLGRLTRKARVICVGTAWHPEDFMHVVGAQWAAADPGAQVRFPVIDDDSSSPHYGRSNWPQHWPMERIEARRAESSPLEFARQMLCVARDDDAARFKREFIEKALARGNGRKMLPLGIPQLYPGFRTYTGVDLGVSQKDSADLTSLFTILVHPDGTREVIDVDAGRWPGHEIISRIKSAHHRYHSIVWVEDNGAQQFLVQFARDALGSVPIRSFTTGRNKMSPDFGVESLATEMYQGKWMIPNDSGRTSKEVSAWIDEMLHYDPRGHTGDRLMSSWIAREGARAGAVSVQPLKLDLLRR
jgi:hypothetical protein